MQFSFQARGKLFQVGSRLLS